MHLIIGDMINLRSVQDTLVTCKSIVIETKNSQILRAHFTELQKAMGQI